MCKVDEKGRVRICELFVFPALVGCAFAVMVVAIVGKMWGWW